MSRKTLVRMCVLSGLVCLWQASAAQAQFKKLLGKIPGNANALVVINVEQIHNSAYGKSVGLKARHEARFAESAVFLPPDATRMVMAAGFDLSKMEPYWQLAMMEMKSAPAIAAIARAEGGFVDQIAGHEAAWSPLDAYFIKVAPQVMAMVMPASRQRAARWLRGEQMLKSYELPTYLQHVSLRADSPSTHLLMALELKDVVGFEGVRNTIDVSETLAGKVIDLDAMAKLLVGIQGITLDVTFSDTPVGTISVAFAEDAAMIKLFAKALLLEVLEDHGVMIEDFRVWQPSVAGKTFTLQGEFTESGLRTVFSLLELPASGSHMAKAEEIEEEKFEPPSKAEASQAYFKSVTTLLDDLGSHKGNVWFKKTAKRIGELSVLNVDEDLQMWGYDVTTRLYEVTGVKVKHRSKAAVREAQYRPGESAIRYSYHYGGRYGGRRYRARTGMSWEHDRRQKMKTEEKAKARAESVGALQEIGDMTAQIRIEMTNRYKIEF